ncbi:hypothetical protein F5B17DRAFT_421478 [Nemania serpens]|nr:hypothetical protein F5B17DRAFT_421478 [Nemania serpens]
MHHFASPRGLNVILLLLQSIANMAPSFSQVATLYVHSPPSDRLGVIVDYYAKTLSPVLPSLNNRRFLFRFR